MQLFKFFIVIFSKLFPNSKFVDNWILKIIEIIGAKLIIT